MYVLKLERPEDFSFIAGQFMNIMIEHEGKKLPRSYSISSHPREKTLECIIKFPEGSRARGYFESLKAGDMVEVRAPYGHYVYQNTELEKVHIVTGSGLGPNLSMLKEWGLRGAQQPSHLFAGIQKYEYLPYAQVFMKWQDQLNFKFYPCVSREAADNQTIFEGRVLKVLEDQMKDYSNKEFYICGIPQMVEDTVTFLKEQGVSDDKIFLEAFTEMGV
jgi:ferredoxin-NADP reductase